MSYLEYIQESLSRLESESPISGEEYTRLMFPTREAIDFRVVRYIVVLEGTTKTRGLAHSGTARVPGIMSNLTIYKFGVKWAVPSPNQLKASIRNSARRIILSNKAFSELAQRGYREVWDELMKDGLFERGTIYCCGIDPICLLFGYLRAEEYSQMSRVRIDMPLPVKLLEMEETGGKLPLDEDTFMIRDRNRVDPKSSSMTARPEEIEEAKKAKKARKPMAVLFTDEDIPPLTAYRFRAVLIDPTPPELGLFTAGMEMGLRDYGATGHKTCEGTFTLWDEEPDWKLTLKTPESYLSNDHEELTGGKFGEAISNAKQALKLALEKHSKEMLEAMKKMLEARKAAEEKRKKKKEAGG